MKNAALAPRAARWLLALAAALLLVSCGPADAPEGAAAGDAAGAVVPPFYPTHNGYIYTQSCSGGRCTLTLGAGGNYSTTWTGVGDFIAGEGWAVGGRRTLPFAAALTASSGVAQVGLYGWLRAPLIEYRVVETWEGTRPAPGTLRGTVASDGGVYDVYAVPRVNQPSIVGTATFWSYWIVRQAKRSAGVITVGNHFDALARLGVRIGTYDYMLLATEAARGSGSSSVTPDASPTSGGAQ